MKNVLSMLLLFSVCCFSQNNTNTTQWQSSNNTNLSATDSLTENSTTNKEYLYLTKGYKEDLANGKDIISGYKLLSGYERQVGNYKFSVQYLYQNDEKLKAISIIIHSFVSNKDHFICIPIKNETLLLANYEQIKTFTPELAQAYSLFVSENFANMLLNYDLELKQKK